MFDFVASAVDSKRRKDLWQMLFTGLQGATKLLATQQKEVLKKVQEVLYIQDGRVTERELSEELG